MTFFPKILQNFLMGGAIVSSISYAATYLNPLLAALFWAYPVTLLPSIYFMKQKGKTNAYISKFLMSSTFSLVILFSTTFALSYFTKHDESNSLLKPVGKATLVWALTSLTFFVIIKVLHLEKHFM